MVTITADQIRALSKLIDKAGVEEFIIQEDSNDNLFIRAFKGGTEARVTMNAYGRPAQHEDHAASN